MDIVIVEDKMQQLLTTIKELLLHSFIVRKELVGFSEYLIFNPSLVLLFFIHEWSFGWLYHPSKILTTKNAMAMTLKLGMIAYDLK